MCPSTATSQAGYCMRNSTSPPAAGESSQITTSRRQLVTAAMLALTACAVRPAAAVATEAAAAVVESAPATSSKTLPETVYFGNGCFWGRQKDFVDTELALGRPPEQVSSLVGYAGGAQAGPGDKVCYYYSDPRTVYEKLGHAEVVQLNISGDVGDARQEFRRFADTYFNQFRKTPLGMQRLDPQDAGPGYRNVVGIPGGVKSPLFQVLKEANVNGMELREGRGGAWASWNRPTEDDLLNVVWVVDSNQLPFYRAERYHQFHNGIGKAFPSEYTQSLKEAVARAGRIDPTGCPELPF
eukprot:CAMPEP_0202897334 /NCGR_PEP_ID=MMETSP1392-20130828/6121_1 /ASSEMBLY_ACC=CAM_ASM_000868 /TAXON_ID=225041 /ORGANISM="Chlamydomonas chlamydogama, Strain SAG 11-48b" /LENGTH=296 /DNA_ID=CAMNT_0049582943 /DNA_START=108 /DNA_END=999 /DNA_ORIENTATION=-